MRQLSIVIPCYNEKDTLQKIVEKIHAIDISPLKKEIVIVDDGSTDGSKELLENLIDCDQKIYNERNLGKSASLRKGISASTGDIILVQDADLEYDPKDIPLLLCELKNSNEIIFGSRYMKTKQIRKKHSVLYWGSRAITETVNFLYGTRLTDVATCYKLFYKKTFEELNIQTSGFQFCVELTAKALNLNYIIKEIQISYYPRGKEEGKKINSIDGIMCFYTLIKSYVFRRT